MKKIILSIILISNISLAADNSTEDFFYSRGYEVGYQNGFDEGVKRAFAEAKKMLKLYENELQAYEIGKYLIKTQNLTYPQVWQELDNNNVVKLRIVPSRIEKEINVDELFSKFATIPTINASQQDRAKLTLEEKNSVFLNARDANINDMPQNVNSAINKFNLIVEKTSDNLDILKRANVVFSDEGEAYKVLFFTKQEQQDFCKQYEICNK